MNFLIVFFSSKYYQSLAITDLPTLPVLLGVSQFRQIPPGLPGCQVFQSVLLSASLETISDPETIHLLSKLNNFNISNHS